MSEAAQALEKHSHGLAQFVESIHDASGLTILDIGGICQENVSFLTDLGHRLYSEDFLRTLDSMTHPDDPPGGPSRREQMDAFLDETLRFPIDHFDGALIWDTLQFLSRPLLQSTVDRLHKILRPGSYLLALFHTTENAPSVPTYAYRILGRERLGLVPRGQRAPVQYFNNRDIERVFGRFDAVKFFLTRDALREVIVKR